jgi:hypothetical protein
LNVTAGCQQPVAADGPLRGPPLKGGARDRSQDHMGTFDPDAHLSSLRARGRKLCFYPSSGSKLLWAVMRLVGDVFVFSDYGPRDVERRKRFWHEVTEDFGENAQPLSLVKSTERTRLFKSGDKWGFLFFQDNNDALARIVRSGWSIDVFVGIRDGCAEGGNYECVHENPFLVKLLAAASNPLTYLTNHSSLLVDGEETQRKGHVYFRPRVLHEPHWEFVLRCVLVIPNRADRDRRYPEAFYPSRGHQAPSFSTGSQTPDNTGCELLKLAEFRVRHNEGVLAQYEVTALKPQQGAAADASRG